MTGRVRGITIDVADLGRSAEFWGSLTGLTVTNRYDTYLWFDEFAPGIRLILQQVPEVKQQDSKNRVHLDLQADEHDDLVRLAHSLGATHLAEVDDPAYSLTVMADPDGNEFCVLHRLSATLAREAEMPSWNQAREAERGGDES